MIIIKNTAKGIEKLKSQYSKRLEYNFINCYNIEVIV